MKFRIEKLTETEGFKLIIDLTTAKEMYLFALASYSNNERGGIFSDFIEENNIELFMRTYTIVDDMVSVSFDFYTYETGFEKRVVNPDDSDAVKTINFIQENMNKYNDQ